MSRWTISTTSWAAGFLALVVAGVLVLRAVDAGGQIAAAPESEVKAEVQGPRAIAVKFHADWCGYCKAMGNVFEEMQAKFDTLPVLYITLDQTREFDRRQSQYLAQALGLEKVWAEHGGKTGFILLVDGRSREVIQTLKHDQTLKDMGAKLVEAVEKASS